MTEYVPVAWGEEPVSVEKLHQMATNDQALFEMKPSMAIRHEGISRNKGMKVLASSQLFSPTNTWATSVDLYFGNYFSVGCKPVVICNIYGFPQTATYIHPKGLSGTKIPDHRGFSVYVRSNERTGKGLGGKLVHPFYITYIAAGY